MELRETISALFAAAMTAGQYGSPDEFAGFVLDIPEIRDALAEKRINAMSPAQFGERLLGELPSVPPSTAAQ